MPFHFSHQCNVFMPGFTSRIGSGRSQRDQRQPQRRRRSKPKPCHVEGREVFKLHLQAKVPPAMAGGSGRKRRSTGLSGARIRTWNAITASMPVYCSLNSTRSGGAAGVCPCLLCGGYACVLRPRSPKTESFFLLHRGRWEGDWALPCGDETRGGSKDGRAAGGRGRQRQAKRC